MPDRLKIALPPRIRLICPIRSASDVDHSLSHHLFLAQVVGYMSQIETRFRFWDKIADRVAFTSATVDPLQSVVHSLTVASVDHNFRDAKMATQPTLDLQQCRHRQSRLLSEMSSRGVEQLLVTRSDSITWLTGIYLGPLLEVAALLDADGSLTLCLPARKAETPVAADRVVTYKAKWLSTMRNDQAEACANALLAELSPRATLGAEFSKFNQHAAAIWSGNWVDFEPTIWQLRRHKQADELAMLAFANEANRQMYERAREIVSPGLNELDLYSELYRVTVDALGEPPTYFGQDFRCAARGGAPRDRACQAGELWILDLGVGYRGYYSDNARTIAVGGEPSSAQQQAWQQLAAVFPVVEQFAKPGASCKQLYETVLEQLKPAEPWLFNHHLGHGVGLAPHEGPHLNPNWDDTFAEGDFFTAEPGLYHEDLKAGIRLEQNYAVTTDGVELVTDWPLGL